MKNIFKKVMGIVIVISLFLGVLAVQPKNAQAANVNKKAGKALAKALIQGKVKYDGKYCLCDINSDGVKELVVERMGGYLHYVIWKYANGKVSKLADFNGEGSILTYDKKTKTFWNLGDGDGGWMHPYKLKKGKFKETGTWYYIRSDGKRAEKNTKNGAKKISVKKYKKIENRVIKNNAMKMKRLKKSKLILKLQNKKLYTQKEFHLSDKDMDKGIQIVNLSAKSMQYQKVKIQTNDIGDAEWLPYSKRVFSMGYSKKIDVYLLFDGGMSGFNWVKTYSGISYKKMKKIFDKPYTRPFALIKDKKGRITKMVELFVS